MTAAPLWIDADTIAARVTPDLARRLLRTALESGFDPADDPARTSAPVGDGQFLLMPSGTPDAAGVKVLSVNPANGGNGLPRIQGWYLLFDAATLAPAALLDGTALTTLRTPAVSALAAESLAPDDADHLVVVGTGPQAVAHAEAMSAVRPLRRVTLAGRDESRAAACAAAVSRSLPDATVEAVRAGGADLEAAVRDAGLVVCATSSATPVLASEWVVDGACVVAVGSHEADRRELDTDLMGRSQVVVEDVATAMREAGDVIMACNDGVLRDSDLHTLRQLVTGAATRATDRPNVVKTVGMSWEDLVIAHGCTRGSRSDS